MNIHEYQAKSLLASYGVTVPTGRPILDPTEAKVAAAALEGPVWVVKAQIHAGGRGKAGGIELAKSADEAATLAREMMGRVLITHQTGPAGKEVRRVYIEQGSEIARELYLGCVIDRATGRVTLMVSTEGGVEIEDIAAKTPERIHKVAIDPAIGLRPFHARKLSFALGLGGTALKTADAFITGIYNAFVGLDASLLEINPLVVTGSGALVALDAKMNFDDNALYRHPEVANLRDESEEDPIERESAEHGLSYVKLDGNIGCMVNGAGLAMATMDIIKFHGGEPANFLDVGGGATRERVAEAFKLILSDPNVEGILVNIFGGIMRCDVIADGVVEAAREISLNVPLVVRLEGTNVEKGKKILAASGHAIVSADDLDSAAEKIVATVGDTG